VHAGLARLERAECQATPRGCRPVPAARHLDGSDARCQIPAVRARGIRVSWFLLNTRSLGHDRLHPAVVVPSAWAGCGGACTFSYRRGRRALRCRSRARRPWAVSSSDISSPASGIIYDPRCGAVADHVAALGLAAPRTPRGRPGRLRTVNNLPVAPPVRQLQVRPCRRSHHGERHRAVVRRPSTRELDQSRPHLD
jgi:hypothetical protein